MPQDTLKVPERPLIILIGSTGAGKSTFARRLFRPTEIVSSDACWGLVAAGTGHGWFLVPNLLS
ncbi:AAA family ATPase [Hymenobacter artigasi]|uniref:ABC-type phosphate transport system ATPase subunit n=1 Tax=Hymenobacter artigasi TaxID=2719616 RepID=A0ABX1HGW3_9BACT|nr:AAA family ATPase [Hymenobacter artigasi]NKI89435.1 ABC-type phosphate transport system ATPase subunit [Hymenobacter artigasi]